MLQFRALFERLLGEPVGHAGTGARPSRNHQDAR
jgi:hypothetical protein